MTLLFCWPACVLSGCLQVPEADGAVSRMPGVTIAAHDQHGEEAALTALPRRPTLELEHPRGFAGPEAIALLEGDADDDLVADLGAAPLRSEHEGRLLQIDTELRGTTLEVAPHAALRPASDYVLAIFGGAKNADGDALFEDREPRLFVLRTAAGAEAGAAVTRTFPADGATGVAVNLAAAVIAFDGAVLGASEGVWLQDALGRAVDASVEDAACADVAPWFDALHCARITPRAALAALAEYALVVGGAAHDAHGAAVGPSRTRFRTGTGRDERQPATLALGCALDEQVVEPGCALIDDHAVGLRVQADEPVLAALAVRDAADAASRVADQGELELSLASLSPDTPLTLTLRLTDAAGNERTFELALRTTPALPSVSIDEVRADPLGPEPAQEYVELLNYGAGPVELLGLAITDDPLEPGVAIERALRLDPGARVLVVGDAFDPRDVRDGALPPGIGLLRAPGPIAGSGLSNAGESILLRDAQGRRLSGAPATPKPRAGVCLQRSSDDPRDARPEAFAYDPNGGCTPGF